MSDGLDAGETLGKKVGPLPVAGWLAAVFGGLGIAWYLRSRGINPDAQDAGTYDPGALATSPTSGTGGAAISDPYGPATEYDEEVPNAPAITTNAQWRIAAVKYLIGLNYSGTSAEQAVAAYFAGTKLSATQGTMINQVLAGIGPTPAPVPPISIATTGTSVSTPPISNDGNYHPPVPGTTPTGTATHPSAPLTNTEWAPHAIWWLTQHGNYDKGMSKTAASSFVHTYLAGRGLTQHGATEIRRVIAGYRPPPHPLAIRLLPAAATAGSAAPTDARRDTGTL